MNQENITLYITVTENFSIHSYTVGRNTETLTGTSIELSGIRSQSTCTISHNILSHTVSYQLIHVNMKY